MAQKFCVRCGSQLQPDGACCTCAQAATPAAPAAPPSIAIDVAEAPAQASVATAVATAPVPPSKGTAAAPSKFCQRCGRPKNADGVCGHCPPAAPPQGAPPTAGAQGYFAALWSIIVFFLKHPIEAMTGQVRITYREGLIFTAVLGASIVLLIMASADAVADAMGPFGGMVSSSLSKVGFKIFVLTELFVFIGLFAHAGVTALVAKLFKGNGDFLALVALLGMATLPVSTALLLTWFIAQFSLPLALLICAIACIPPTILGLFAIDKVYRLGYSRSLYVILVTAATEIIIASLFIAK